MGEQTEDEPGDETGDRSSGGGFQTVGAAAAWSRRRRRGWPRRPSRRRRPAVPADGPRPRGRRAALGLRPVLQRAAGRPRGDGDTARGVRLRRRRTGRAVEVPGLVRHRADRVGLGGRRPSVLGRPPDRSDGRTGQPLGRDDDAEVNNRSVSEGDVLLGVVYLRSPVSSPTDSTVEFVGKDQATPASNNVTTQTKVTPADRVNPLLRADAVGLRLRSRDLVVGAVPGLRRADHRRGRDRARRLRPGGEGRGPPRGPVTAGE